MKTARRAARAVLAVLATVGTTASFALTFSTAARADGQVFTLPNAGTSTTAPSASVATGVAGVADAPLQDSVGAASATSLAYRSSLRARHLGGTTLLSLDDVRGRLSEAETLRAAGRIDEAIGRLYDMVEEPRFSLFVQTPEGRGILVALGDALADAGAYLPARVYLRRVIALPNAWSPDPTEARRAVRRLVEIALESEHTSDGIQDVASVPTTVPEETRGEVMYLEGRAYEASGDARAADLAYANVTPRSRWWSQATYLRGLLAIEAGRVKDAEDLFCKVADPKRQGHTTPVFADERFFAVRDLARLALGRLAHEESRFDDARYYYYLVPTDSDRLAEALYEAATSRYEKKDYDGAMELLSDLDHVPTANGTTHHAYEDEALILRAYVELGRCHFPEADKLLRIFIQTYEPVRDGARRLLGSDALLRNFARGATSDNSALAALVRLDRQFASLLHRRSILDKEASGLEVARNATRSMRLAIGTPGAVQPNLGSSDDDERLHAASSREKAERALAGLEHAIADAEGAGGQAGVADAKAAALRIEASLGGANVMTNAAAAPAAADANSADLAALLQRDDAQAGALLGAVDGDRQALDVRELALGREAVTRVDLRLSRLLRRARLGRIESVLGRKRALEIEVEAIQDGVLPQGAIDSLDAARYLEDNEEYWPYEGDDWPDEYVGGEGLR